MNFLLHNVELMVDIEPIMTERHRSIEKRQDLTALQGGCLLENDWELVLQFHVTSRFCDSKGSTIVRQMRFRLEFYWIQ